MNALLTLLLALNAAAEAPAPAKVDAAKLFAGKCTTCHAKDGTGSPAMAKMFKADIQKMNLAAGDAVKAADADLIKVINEGRGKMNSFKGKLKDEEIKALVAYIRSLQAKPADPKAPAKP